MKPQDNTADEGVPNSPQVTDKLSSSQKEEQGEVAPLDLSLHQGMTPEQIVDKLEELVRFALEYEKRDIASGVSFVEVFKELKEIQKSLDLMNTYQKETMKLLSEVAEREGISMPSDEEALSEEDKKIINKLKSLTDMCEAAKARAHAEIVQNPDIQKAVTEKIQDATSSDERKQLRRKNKFRGVGGKSGWMPM